MASFYEHDNPEVDASAIAWKQHFGLSEDNPEEAEWDEIKVWLQEIAPHLKIPEKKDVRLLESIKRLKLLHEGDIEADSIIEAFDRQSLPAYHSEADYLVKEMHNMGLDKNQLSTTCLAQLKSLATVASTLNLSNCHISSIQTAIASMTLERMDLQMEKDQMHDYQLDVRQKTEQVQAILQDMNKCLSSLKEKHQNLDVAEQHKWSAEMAVLERKSEDYRNLAATLQETYADRKIDERKLVFSKLKSFQNEIEELEDTLEIGQQKLQQYFGLPLDTKDAAAKLRSMYDTLHFLRRQRDELLQSIADSVR
ncbi:unnamed protein product [Umbelopsis sp. WA50703]